MNLIKHSLAIVLSIIFTLFSSSIYSKKRIIRPNYIISIGKPIYFTKGERQFLTVPTFLTNNSSDTLTYFSMTCSYYDVYLFESKQLTWSDDSTTCISNFPTLIKLGPFKKIQQNLRLEFKEKVEFPIKIKVGLKLIKNEGDNGINFLLHKQVEATTLWSEEVTLKK